MGWSVQARLSFRSTMGGIESAVDWFGPLADNWVGSTAVEGMGYLRWYTKRGLAGLEGPLYVGRRKNRRRRRSRWFWTKVRDSLKKGDIHRYMSYQWGDQDTYSLRGRESIPKDTSHSSGRQFNNLSPENWWTKQTNPKTCNRRIGTGLCKEIRSRGDLFWNTLDDLRLIR